VGAEISLPAGTFRSVPGLYPTVGIVGENGARAPKSIRSADSATRLEFAE
jgi:hypothetical protein